MRAAAAIPAALALALAGAGGCSVLRDARSGPTAEAWERARAQATREARSYDRFETHAIASATWLSPEVRARRADQVADWRAMTDGERAALKAAEAAEAARVDEFVVSLFTSDLRDNDLDAPQSIWRVALLAEGQPERDAPKIQLLSADAQLRNLYPFIHTYDTVYRVTFRRVEGGPPLGEGFTLRIAGSRGRLDFRY
jgi:hypothetical protein